MEDDILYNLFLTDLKKLDISEVSSLNKSIERVLRRYSLNIGDYENHAVTESIFIRLGWNNRY